MTLNNRLQRWIARIAARSAGATRLRQAGAIPYTVVEGRTVFLLITTRRTGRWIFPKGAPMDGYQPWQVAAQEAFEEAGVEGEVETTPIGTYRTVKSGINRTLIDVDVYPLKVERQLEEWPEMAKRLRHWVMLPEARRLLSEPKLAEFAATLDARLRRAQPTNLAASA